MQDSECDFVSQVTKTLLLQHQEITKNRKAIIHLSDALKDIVEVLQKVSAEVELKTINKEKIQ